MRNRERLLALKDFVYQRLCQGREMKTLPPDADITKIAYQEPQCFLGWAPTRPDKSGYSQSPVNVCPGIIIMPAQSNMKNMGEKRFDKYSGIHRPQEMGQSLNVQFLLSVYEPGIRLPGFAGSADSPEGLDVSLLAEGTQEGLLTLVDWMDDLSECLLGERFVPGIIDSFDAIVNTVPALVIDRRLLEKVKAGAVCLDLASVPGGMDMDAAAQLGVHAVWALSLPGKCAPESAGHLMLETIYNMLEENGK